MRTPLRRRIQWFLVKLFGGKALIFPLPTGEYRAYVALQFGGTATGTASSADQAFMYACYFAGYRKDRPN